MKKDTMDNSLKTLRVFLFEEIIKIRKGEAVEKESIAISKLSSQIINSYNTEILALKTVNELKDKHVPLANQLGVIDVQQTSR